MLNSFVTAKRDQNREDKSQRPYLASECDNVPDCELYRGQILKEISKKVSLIQNEGLDEHRIRELNDAINKLVREKGHWERRIKELGGADHFRTAPKIFDGDGGDDEIVQGKGYKYYGAAKKLPGVREHLRRAPPEKAKRTRGEIFKTIDAAYYGYGDDDDGVLAELERGGAGAAGDARRGVGGGEAAEADPDAAAAEAAADAEAAAAGDDDEEFVAQCPGGDQRAVLARRKNERSGCSAGGRRTVLGLLV